MIRNTLNKDPKKIKRQRFFAKYGVTIAVGGCAFIALIVTIITNGQFGPKPNVSDNEYLMQPTAVPEYEYLQNAPTPVPLVPLVSMLPMDKDTEETSGNQPDVSEVSNETDVSTSVVPELTIPVNGEIKKGYAKDALVYSPTLKEYSTHLALDIHGELGQSVVASADGEVILCGEDRLLGNYVVIKHSELVSTGYYSLGSYNVKVGDELLAGDVLGTIGTSALLENSLGNHVHFELVVDNYKLDPVEYFKTK